MVFKATFNNISVILWRSVLLVVETGVPGETGSCKSNYHTITTMTAHSEILELMNNMSNHNITC